ncbi:33218_t:CDS:2, partial [Racocetra persica]
KTKEYMELVIRKMKERNLSLTDAIDNILDNAENKEERSAKIEILIPFSNTYEIFHGEWLNFKDFKATNTVERLWKKFVEYARAYTENDNLSISTETKKSICSNFTKCLNVLIPFIEKYDTFFHHLVYHMRYKEHIFIPDKIGRPEMIRKMR